jgi:hypothetical protein
MDFYFNTIFVGRSRDSCTGIATGYGLDDQASEFESRLE